MATLQNKTFTRFKALNKTTIMKKTTNNILFGALCATFIPFGSVFAQQVSPTDNKPDPATQTPVTVPYPGISNLNNTGIFNYIKTIIPDAPFQVLPGSNAYPLRSGTQFYDGLGRPMQTVSRKAHANGNDIVSVNVYDALGNETYHYLPYAAPTGGLNVNNTGNIKLNENTQLRGFYDQNGPDEQPYSQTAFDNSPLNRVTKSMAPGRSWVGSGRGKEFSYKTNSNPVYNQSATVVYTTAGNFPRFTIGNNNTDLPVYAGNYNDGQLYINKTKDEDGKVVEEMKDKDGRVIMKRSLLAYNKETTYPTSGPTDIFPANYTYTHYVYNDMGQLRCVIPPTAIQPVLSNFSTTTGTVTTNTYTYTWASPTVAQVNGLCYTYFYDERGRVVEKKIPGKKVEFFIYDKRDRLIFSQDGNMRNLSQPLWHFTLYDALDRPTISGFAIGPTSREVTLNWFNNYTSNSPIDIYYYINNYNLFHAYPASLNDCKIYNYTYYDDYSQLSGLGFDASQFSGITLPAYNTVVPSVLSNATTGLPTWSKIRVLDPDDPNAEQWLTTANYYDANGRVIQSISQNLQGGTDISSNLYYFQGMLYKNIMKHVNPAALAIPNTTDPVMQEYTLLNTFERNVKVGGGNDQVWKRTQKINNGPDYELSFYAYDHLNRNTWKQWTTGFNRMDYNLTGFLNRIAFWKYNTDTAFTENLYYDKGFKSKLFNGNIAGITWSGSDHVKKAYGYSYDNLNRLNHAEFNQFNVNTNAWDKLEGYDYTASNISYDLNGNIKTMNQMGHVPAASSSTLMDILTYTYAPNSNQLKNVKDNGTVNPALPDFKDDASNNPTSVEEYLYDSNGNLSLDDNKKVGSITYNYLNKPEKIVVSGKGSITYTYDAAGNRLRKKSFDNTTGITEVWDYDGGFVYKDNVLQYILNEEGRARPVAASHSQYPTVPAGESWTKFVYDYFVKDHLGNVRSTITSNPTAYNYFAKHNVSTANIENLIFDNITAVRDTKPGSTDPDDMAARLNGAEPDKRIGTAIMLETNPGDRFTINVNAFYDGDYEQDDQQVSSNEMVEALMGTLIGGVSANPGAGDLKGNQALIKNIFSNPALSGQMDQILNTTNDPKAPKAHLNYLWFNEKLELQAASSGSVQVANGANNWKVLTPAVNNNNGLFGTVVDPGIYAPSRGYLVVYIDNQSIGKDVWFDNLSLNMYTSEVLEEDHYYPFGLTMNVTPANQVGTKNPYKYNGKELEKSFGLETYDYGARMYNSQIGRWNGIDGKADLYKNLSPYAYAANNPANAIDPDGNLIIFVNGFTPQASEQGTERYWRSYRNITVQQFDGNGNVFNQQHEVLDKAFDLDVSNQLGDNHRKYIHGGNNIIPEVRSSNGYFKGLQDAPDIIESLHRTNGVIDESIKMVTHSMGGLYGDGYMQGIMTYIQRHPYLASQVQITLVADFDPFQAGEIYNNGKIKKLEFIHKGHGSLSGGLANQKEKGTLTYTTSATKGDHSIMTFFDNIKKLEEGTYKWNEDKGEWQIQPDNTKK
jgi:RHS repeat-associated protein